MNLTKEIIDDYFSSSDERRDLLIELASGSLDFLSFEERNQIGDYLAENPKIILMMKEHLDVETASKILNNARFNSMLELIEKEEGYDHKWKEVSLYYRSYSGGPYCIKIEIERSYGLVKFYLNLDFSIEKIVGIANQIIKRHSLNK